jgi:hypothetical protein
MDGVVSRLAEVGVGVVGLESRRRWDGDDDAARVDCCCQRRKRGTRNQRRKKLKTALRERR